MDERHPRGAALIGDPGRRQFGRSVGAAVLLGSVSACSFGSGGDHSGPGAPLAQPAGPLPANPLALVLSSGGPRGFVHVGVIKALDELGVRPDLVVGASVGALIGSLYCGGMRGVELERLAMSLQPLQLATLAIGGKAMFNGGPLADLVNELIGEQLLQQLTPRCALVALDATTRKPTAFTAGNTGVAVQASAAIEGRFNPVTIRGRPYVDPDSVMPLPVRIARSLGARRVIAVDASAHEDRAPAGAERYRDGDKRKRDATLADARLADLVLHPDFGYWVSLREEFRRRAILAGYEQTLAKRRQLQALT